MAFQKLVTIDGSQLEGGGQILRITTSLAALLGTPVNINKIRAGRSRGGLRPQHLTGLQLIRDISGGQLTGDIVDSSEITFHPQNIDGGSFTADTQTAGSVCLLMQSLLPCCLFARKQSLFTLRGGTNADMAPPIDYTTEVFKKICGKFNINFEANLNVRGFFPKGRGEVTMKVDPIKQEIPPIILMDPGNVVSIKGLSFVAGVLPIKLAHVMADATERVLKSHIGKNIRINIQRFKEDQRRAFGNGSFIIIWAETSTGCILAASGIGKRDLPPEEVGQKVANDLIKDITSGSCVDSYTQDQLVIFMALAKGKSRVRTNNITLHTKTAIHIAETMSQAKFNLIDDPESETVIMECDGIGLEPR